MTNVSNYTNMDIHQEKQGWSASFSTFLSSFPPPINSTVKRFIFSSIASVIDGGSGPWPNVLRDQSIMIDMELSSEATRPVLVGPLRGLAGGSVSPQSFLQIFSHYSDKQSYKYKLQFKGLVRSFRRYLQSASTPRLYCGTMHEVVIRL